MSKLDDYVEGRMQRPICLIHPSRGRPEKAFEACEKWLNSSGLKSIQHILSIDDDDPKKEEYMKLFYYDSKSSYHRRSIISHDNKSAVGAINWAVSGAQSDILVVMSDDFEAPENWALKIIEQTKDKTDWIAKTWDGIQKWIITLPIMDRAYYNRFGYIYHPDYLHMFCDTELTCVADLTGRKISLDIPFTHNHYSTGKSVKDEVSTKADATWDQGEKLFLERARRNFDLVNPAGKITSQEYINWMKMKGVSVQ